MTRRMEMEMERRRAEGAERSELVREAMQEFVWMSQKRKKRGGLLRRATSLSIGVIAETLHL